MAKDMFFYSNFCDHCKEVISVIMKKNIRPNFLFVCVDDNKFQLPSCVTHVPTIITRQKDVLTDSIVLVYIDKLTNTVSNIENNDISPFSMADAAGYSSSYTWLTNDGYDNDGTVSLQNESINKTNYVMLGAETHIFIPNDPDSGSGGSGSSGSKSNKFDSKVFENFINSRNLDDDIVKKTIQKPLI